MGEILVVIGPNGYGKTTFIDNELKRQKAAGRSTLLLPSEIKLLDEVKDTVDTSQTMEYLLSEIIETTEFANKRQSLFDEADKLIANNLKDMNNMVEEILAINGSTRGKDFISPNPKRVLKNLVSISQDDIKQKMGSGQRMQLLLKLVSRSSKECIFLDEPEKYSHPSLLNGTAKAINDLVDKGKAVYIATHSPKLVSMLKVSLSDIKVINDSSHALKDIPFDAAASYAASALSIGNMEDKFKSYHASGSSLMDCIQKRHYRAFIEALFAKKVYLCEGANDELFVNASLQQNGGFYDDYCVFKVWGKTNLLVFEKLFSWLGIDVTLLFDVDDENKEPHKTLNCEIRKLSSECNIVEFVPNLEESLGFPIKKKTDTLAFIGHLEGMPLQAI